MSENGPLCWLYFTTNSNRVLPGINKTWNFCLSGENCMMSNFSEGTTQTVVCEHFWNVDKHHHHLPIFFCDFLRPSIHNSYSGEHFDISRPSQGHIPSPAVKTSASLSGDNRPLCWPHFSHSQQQSLISCPR